MQTHNKGDFNSSPTVTSQMKQKCKNQEKLKHAIADVIKKIPLEDNTFDLITCKATIDTALTRRDFFTFFVIVLFFCDKFFTY